MFGEVSYTFFEDDIVGYVEVVKVGVSTSSFDVGVFGGMPLPSQLSQYYKSFHCFAFLR